MSRTSNPEAVAWRKSTHSSGGDDNCIEVADKCRAALVEGAERATKAL
jgi:hypothetical protein